MNNKLVNELLSFIDQSPSMFHAATALTNILDAHDFEHLNGTDAWSLREGGKYYITANNSAVLAFCVHSTDVEASGFRIVGAHTDVPGFRIKPNPQMTTDSYIKLNTEVYGGPILNTWLDRPLSVAGRVALKSDNPLRPCLRLVDMEKPLLIIPNLAIHMNRNVNDGVALNKQKETLPVLGYIKEQVPSDILINQVAEKLGVAPTDILDMDLFLYPTEKSCTVGLDDAFLSAPRLDDLSMVYSGLHALLHSTSTTGITMLAAFDNEEVGSMTKQGAHSPLLATTLERICVALGKSREAFFRATEQSFLISADVAHLLHPNYPEKSDPTNKVLPGKGPAIKMSANCSYTTDSDSFGVFANLCQTNAIPYQIFVNRSDERGGSTIGPVSTSHIAIRAVDIGTPMLSMHSARELMAADDFIYTTQAMQAFFNL